MKLDGQTLGTAQATRASAKSRPGRRSPRLYVAAVAVFALATLAKGMTLTLPVVLLACAWWQRGRIQAARSVAGGSFPADRIGDGRHGGVPATRRGAANRRALATAC